MNHPAFRYFVALAVAAASSACSGADEQGVSTGDPSALKGKTATILAPTLNPCDPTWHLPSADRSSFSPPSSQFGKQFDEFELRLQRGGALWIGRMTSLGSLRTIVEVTHVPFGLATKYPKSELWYMALVPADSYDALDAIGEYSSVEPVTSKLLGFCYSDGSFVGNIDGTPPTYAGKTFTYYVTEYDPRCTCGGQTARCSVQVGYELYDQL
jgi:hypothetical protein